MRDLLSSVRPAGAAAGGGGGGDGDIEAPAAPPAAAPPAGGDNRDMQIFFARVEEAKGDLSAMRTKQRNVQGLHERSKAIVRAKEMERSREEMQSSINEVNTLAHKLKNRLEALDKLNEEALKKKGCGPGSASERTRTSVTAGLKKKLKDLVGDFSKLRSTIQEEYREVVQRRVFTVTGEQLPEEAIDSMIETGQSETIFQKAILEQGRGRVLDTLAEIQERHRAVKDLEQSLLELHQIFLDMAVLVEAQGEMLDNIEKQVARSVEFVQSGTTALQDAKTYQKKTRKMMCCAIMVLLCVAAIVVIVVVKPWNSFKRG